MIRSLKPVRIGLRASTCQKTSIEAANRLIFFFKILNDLHTFLYKAVPDTKLTIKKYADVKFEYLVKSNYLN